MTFFADLKCSKLVFRVALSQWRDGRIRMVDNMGLMEQGIPTSGFTQ